MSIVDKEDYLDKHIRRHAERVALPPPEQISKNLKVVDHMRQAGHLPQPGRIHVKGVENVKSYTSGAGNFAYAPGYHVDNRTSSGLSYNTPKAPILNKKVGRFSNSPTNFRAMQQIRRDEMLHEFSQDNQMGYLKD